MSIPASPSAALALVKAYHQRSKHRFEAYSAGPQALDWDAQPAAFRHFDGVAQLALPRLADIVPGSALHQALERPLHARADNGACVPIDLASIGAWLQLSLGISAWKSFGPDRWAVRANPSSGNLHPVEAYLLANGIEGLHDGIHHYRPDGHPVRRARPCQLSARASRSGHASERRSRPAMDRPARPGAANRHLLSISTTATMPAPRR